MSSTLVSWLLGGALAASFAWHFRPSGDATTTGTASGSCCGDALAIATSTLTPEQQRELDEWRASACGAACESADEAAAALERLHAALRDPSTPPERLRDLAKDVSRLRERSLDDCVESIVAVRRVLTSDQLGALLDGCCSDDGCAK